MSRIKLRDSFKIIHELDTRSQNGKFDNPNIPESWTEAAGEDIVVGLMDTGCFPHKDFADSLIVNKTVYDTKDDETGHGTFQVGLIQEIAPKAKFVMVKTSSEKFLGDAGHFERATAIIKDSGVDIVCIPFEFNDDNYIVRRCVEEMRAQGIYIVCHYNDSDHKRGSKPAEYDECLSVGRYNTEWLRKIDHKHIFIDYMIPETELISTAKNNKYASAIGDHGGVAWTAGMVALILSKHKKLTTTSPVNSYPDLIEHLNKLTMNIYELRDMTHYGLIDVRRELIE